MTFVLKTLFLLAALFAVLAAGVTVFLFVMVLGGNLRGEAVNQIGGAMIIVFAPGVGLALIAALLSTVIGAVWRREKEAAE